MKTGRLHKPENNKIMNREIKFRAWDGKIMHILEANDREANHVLQFGSGGFWLNSYETGELITSTKKGGIIMQYTGLKDKNGKEIYEKDHDRNGNMIDFCERCSGYQFFQIDVTAKDIINCHSCYGNFLLHDHINDFEIIGNIYSNPELL